MKLALVIAILALPSFAFATPADLKKYKEAYPDKAGEASCKVCHVKGKELNEYGQKYKKADKDFKKLDAEGKKEAK